MPVDKQRLETASKKGMHGVIGSLASSSTAGLSYDAFAKMGVAQLYHYLHKKVAIC